MLICRNRSERAVWHHHEMEGETTALGHREDLAPRAASSCDALFRIKRVTSMSSKRMTRPRSKREKKVHHAINIYMF